jgi:hypothetical protein
MEKNARGGERGEREGGGGGGVRSEDMKVEGEKMERK